MRLLQMSISAGILIAVILCMRCVGRRLFSARFIFLLWFVAAARMILPLELPVQLPGIGVEQVWQDAAQVDDEFQDGVLYGGAMSDEDWSDRASQYGRIAVIIWADGCLLLLILFAWKYIKQLNLLEESIPLAQEVYPGQWKAGHPLKRDVRFMVFDRIMAPLTYGILKPRIVFPKSMDFENTRALEHVLRHEYVHIRRFDNLWKIVVLIAVCVHWFNPMAWVMWHFFNRDMELACDESAVSGMDGSGRRDYAMTLLWFAEKNHKVSLLCNGFGKSAVKERIVILMKNNKRTKIGIICSALVLALSMTVFASTGGSSSGISGSDGESPAKMLYVTPQFKEYEALGLYYNPSSDLVTYDSRVVGYFQDEYSAGTFNRMNDPAGNLCLVAVRDEDGKLTGFREIEETQYLKQASDVERRMARERGYIKEYGPYGLTYDEPTGYLSFDGKIVEAIRDSAGCGIYVNGSFTQEKGTVSLQIERDEKGTVTEVKQMAPQGMSDILEQTIGVRRTEDGWKSGGGN